MAEAAVHSQGVWVAVSPWEQLGRLSAQYPLSQPKLQGEEQPAQTGLMLSLSALPACSLSQPFPGASLTAGS